jgi:hypothetical protein
VPSPKSVISSKNPGAPTIAPLAKPFSTAAQALDNPMHRPFTLGVTAGKRSVEEFQGAQTSLVAMPIEEFGERVRA